MKLRVEGLEDFASAVDPYLRAWGIRSKPMLLQNLREQHKAVLAQDIELRTVSFLVPRLICRTFQSKVYHGQRLQIVGQQDEGQNIDAKVSQRNSNEDLKIELDRRDVCRWLSESLFQSQSAV